MPEIIQNQTAKQRAADGLHTGQLASPVAGVPAGSTVGLSFASVSSTPGASAGSATALPATPAGYFLCVGPNNAIVKVPFYNV